MEAASRNGSWTPGTTLFVWNRSAEKTAPFVAVDTPAQAAQKADAVFVMVSDPQALREVTEEADGILAGATPGRPSSRCPRSDRRTSPGSRRALPDGVELLDAPVLGSLTEAESGTLRVFAGGSPELVERWTPVLSSLGPVLDVGPVGAGTAAKLVANSTLLGALGVLGEALALGRKLGLATDATFEVLSATPLAAQAERRRKPFETGEYPLRFALALGLKDADLISVAADGLDLKVAAAVRDWFAEAVEQGAGEDDYSSILAHIADSVQSDASSSSSLS